MFTYGWDRDDVAIPPGSTTVEIDLHPRERTRGEERFWSLAEPLLQQAGVTRSTMMGFPCLRLDGEFFASSDRRTGHLVIKLNEQRVSALIDADKGEPFAPNGRRFREWISIPLTQRRSWASLLDEALELAADRRPTSPRPSTKPPRDAPMRPTRG